MRGDMTEHFSRREFKCPCGCGKDDIKEELVNRLESVFEYLKKCERGCKYIIITSGIRCPTHSVSVGGYKNDAHTIGYAADWYCVDDNDERYNSFVLAAVAEVFGFGGIGIIDDTAIHTDIRDIGGYANKHWFGNERTGETYQTFAQYLPPAKIINKHKISLFYDGDKIYEKEV